MAEAASPGAGYLGEPVAYWPRLRIRGMADLASSGGATNEAKNGRIRRRCTAIGIATAKYLNELI